jgi:hypothetical protein
MRRMPESPPSRLGRRGTSPSGEAHAQAVVWDMILRGVHNQVILRELGLVPVVAVHARENPERGAGRRAGTYTPKTADLETRTVTLPDGQKRVVHLAAHNGAVAIKELTESGEPHYRVLPCVRIQRHRDKAAYRWYGYYRLPAEYGGGQIPVRLHANADDERRGLNRTEVLRPIPEGSEAYERLISLRPDSESSNNDVKRTHHERRASALGWRRQIVDLLGVARVTNAVTLARCRARERVDAAA